MVWNIRPIWDAIYFDWFIIIFHHHYLKLVMIFSPCYTFNLIKIYAKRVLRFLSVTLNRNNSIEIWRISVVHSSFIQTKSFLSREYKHQLLGWFRFIPIILVLFSKVSRCSYKITMNYSPFFYAICSFTLGQFVLLFCFSII